MIEIPDDGWGLADDASDSLLGRIGAFADSGLAAPDGHWGDSANDDPVSMADNARTRASGILQRQRSISAFNRGLDTLSDSIVESADWAAGLERYDREIESLRERYGGELRNPEDRDAFARHAGEFAAMQRIGLKRALVERQASEAFSQLDEQLGYYAGKAAEADNDVFRQIATDGGLRAIDELREAGYLTPESAEARKSAFLGRIDGADVDTLAKADPNAALNALDGGLFARLPPEAREALRGRIAALLNGAADDGETISDTGPQSQPGDQLAMAKRRPDGSHLPQRPGEGLLEGGGGIGAGGGPTRSPSSPVRREPTESDPVGRRGRDRELKIEPGTNPSAVIEGRTYSGHALDQMQGRGLSPSTVEQAIKDGVKSPGYYGRTLHYDRQNSITIVTEPTGEVVTVWPGRP